ncbi:hypothetical protein EDC01DRAFT_732788 [Geopyxis carbonaria]|nr:hypothetical protein EDC01DRAFT_732788 [Geopyxis carbonaria]
MDSRSARAEAFADPPSHTAYPALRTALHASHRSPDTPDPPAPSQNPSTTVLSAAAIDPLHLALYQVILVHCHAHLRAARWPVAVATCAPGILRWSRSMVAAAMWAFEMCEVIGEREKVLVVMALALLEVQDEGIQEENEGLMVHLLAEMRAGKDVRIILRGFAEMAGA